ncbi:MAG TPA: hypothetical protein PL009_01190 [Flavipsychrobacter sp.]|nr:hypothetical protein [Flavipsychrobacter sp.]
MQQNIDSSTFLYSCAIIDMKANMQKEAVINKYRNKLLYYHENINATLDSIHKLYIKGKITESQYQTVIQYINLDSVRSKVMKLKLLGVEIPLARELA